MVLLEILFVVEFIFRIFDGNTGAIDLPQKSVPIARRNLIYGVSRNSHTVPEYLCLSPTLAQC